MPDRSRHPLLRLLTWPLITGGAVTFVWLALAWGWALWAVGLVVLVGTNVAVEALERIVPYSPTWTRPQGDHATDVWHFLLSNRFADLGTLAGLSLCAPLGVWLSAGASLWPHQAPLALQAILALVLFELPGYWIHRLEHGHPLFWRLHAVHHSAPRMYWWNFSRNHPLDNLLSTFAGVGLLALLGVGEAPLALAVAFAGTNGLLQHANVDARTGWLDSVFNTARVHRWHHSRRLTESNANYGPTLTIWDHVFGTRRFAPEAVPSEDVGLAVGTPGSRPFPEDFLGQVWSPFVAELWR